MTDAPELPPASPIPPICPHCGTNRYVVVLNIIKGEMARASWWCELCDTAVFEKRP
jgi:transposase-like protein